jgi:RimJ/RimL family protein N-acetyltransferase
MFYSSPRLKTAIDKLILRPLDFDDAPEILEYAGHADVAATTLHIPHPYPPEDAEIFVAATHDNMQNGRGFTFAMTRDDKLIGCIGLGIQPENNVGEMGYWLGKPYWGQGYTTEAARRMITFSFDELLLNKVFAQCFVHNTASARVMQKAGMTYEGTLRQHIRKAGTYHDLHCYGILRVDFEDTHTTGTKSGR